jgi:23S rRNA (cytidine2498-2'-O)-methyltransferase
MAKRLFRRPAPVPFPRSDEKGRPGPLGARAGLIFWVYDGCMTRSSPTSPSPRHDTAAATLAPARPAPAVRGTFLLATCQGGAEASLCRRQETVLPAVSKAAWRRGVVTFRLGTFDPPDDFFPDLVYPRTIIRCLGQVTGTADAERIAAVRSLVGHDSWDAIHVWHRDHRLEAEVDTVPIRAGLLAAYGMPDALPPAARPGDLVLDCLIDAADRWWVGWHRGGTPASCQPGGMHPTLLPAEKVSRAWLKLDEAIATFGVDLRPGQRAVELGASPGGACQRLLEAGLEVVGIDPALVDQRVASQPGFEQWRMRARDVKVKAFRGFDWIVADMNIDPRSTLASIGRIVTAAGVKPAGIIATLKLPDWSRAEELAGWLEQFRAWGYNPRGRQLSTGGREICVVALRTRRR